MKVLPRIEKINEKKLVGMRINMSLADNKTAELWRTFMPKKKEIIHQINEELISLQQYQPNHFTYFSVHNQFEKWACVEVSDFNALPANMETLILESGLYAVFHYKGLNTDTSIFQYIFGTWLPSSSYVLDNRPHFEVLGEKYKNNDVNSEEEIWIPITNKS